MEPRKVYRGGQPTVCTHGKAAVLSAFWRVRRTPPGSESGACLHRGNSGTWESHRAPGDRPGMGDRATQSPGVGWALRPGHEPGGETTNEGSTPGIGERATSEEPREGQVAVVASHPTVERGEVRPKRPTGGKATSGRAVSEERYTRETRRSPIVSPHPCWTVCMGS